MKNSYANKALDLLRNEILMTNAMSNSKKDNLFKKINTIQTVWLAYKISQTNDGFTISDATSNLKNQYDIAYNNLAADFHFAQTTQNDIKAGICAILAVVALYLSISL